jgi:hypothetical protein
VGQAAELHVGNVDAIARVDRRTRADFGRFPVWNPMRIRDKDTVDAGCPGCHNWKRSTE